MGIALSIISKQFRDFNLERRVHKVISQDKPKTAPKHKSDQLDLERLMKAYPEVYQALLKKSENLDKHLKDVFVTSQDPMPQPPQSSSSADRPLPLARESAPDFEFGFREPQKVPYGRVTLRSALKFITKHQSDPMQYPVSKIMEDHKLPEETVRNIVKNFRIFEIYLPTERDVKATFIGPLVTRTQVFTHKHKELPKEDDKDKS